MKRTISFILSLVMVVGICATFPFAKIEVSAVEGSELFKVQASEFQNDKITYTVYLKKGVKISGSIIYAKFDPAVLAIDAENTGADMTTDSYGDECQSIKGAYEQGFMAGTDNKYSVAHICGSISDYNAGSTDKPYMQFTFKAIDGNRPKTTVNFYCYEFINQSDDSNNIPNGSDSLIYSYTGTTLGKVIIKSVESEKNGVRICWEKVTGADSYRIYKNGEFLSETTDNTVSEYFDTEVKNNTSYSYAVRAVNEASYEDENGEKYPAAISDIVSIRYTAAPSEISVSNICGGIVVEWSKVEGATAYKVYRRTVNADGVVSSWEAFEDNVSDNTYTDTATETGTTYQYAVRAYSDGGYSDLSVEKEIVYSFGEHSYGDGFVTLEPTCTLNGAQTRTCTVCGYVTTEPIEKLGHDYSGEWITDIAPTCIEEGSKYKACTVCGERLATEAIDKTEHIVSDWIIDKASTCKEEGLKHRECTMCGIVLDTKTISISSHATYWEIVKEATCIETGIRIKKCETCEVEFETETINAKGHTAGDWKTDKEATVYKAGKKVKKCTVCGETVETGTIKQLKCDKPSLKKIENTADGVKLTWDKVEGADKYEVYYRKGSKGKYTKLGTTSKNYVTHKKAKSGNKYYYVVKAINEAGASSASGSKSIYYLADPTLKTPNSTKSGIVLKWNKIAGADGYMVYRKTGSGKYSKIATVKGNSKVTYTDKKASKGKTYTYKVKAYKSKTSSALSNAKKIKDKY